MTTTNYLSVCKKAAYAAGEVLREKLGSVTAKHKSNRFDLVTEADVTAQKTIEKIIFDNFPTHQIIGEEETTIQENNKNSDFKWIIDPLDGTTNYVHGLPFFCVSIALAQNNEIICGTIYNPVTDEFFHAEKNQGAFLNNKQIHTSSCQSLDEALVSVGFPTIIDPDSQEIQLLLRACPQCQAIRRTGSTALNLAYIASGRLDAGWAFKCHVWDIAAGVLLIKEAGGIITEPNNSPINIQNDPTPFCAAANKTLHNSLIKDIVGIANIF
ncbi:MAG: inositol monophosphatase [Planctomycetaceae bacterium]|jgi:myo-inositol-1(or 4)-monophosphatase|nr:inositol monophosphatase [Planctomycetaceae bacterium]